MTFPKHYVAKSDLLTLINQHYAIKGERIRLYRTSQGRVFFIQTPAGRKVFKLYLPTVTDAAIQTTRIITYLDECDYPIVKIIPTVAGELYVLIERPEGICVGVLFEYASGICIWCYENSDEWIMNPLTEPFSRQVGLMHRLMDNYKEPLISRESKKQIFDDAIAQMRHSNYDESRVRNLEAYGNELWDVLSKCPVGFYHADMHAGNTKYHKGQFTWMDFDKACLSYNVMDFGWLLQTDWLKYHDESIERSLRLLDEVYTGYSMEKTLSDVELQASIHCVGIIHFEALGLDSKVYGKGTVHWILDREYEWLMRWRECCYKLLKM